MSKTELKTTSRQIEVVSEIMKNLSIELAVLSKEIVKLNIPQDLHVVIEKPKLGRNELLVYQVLVTIANLSGKDGQFKASFVLIVELSKFNVTSFQVGRILRHVFCFEVRREGPGMSTFYTVDDLKRAEKILFEAGVIEDEDLSMQE
jgi:hypothetical protein